MSLEKTIELVKSILVCNNIDLTDPNFKDTPTRAGKFFHQFLKGYTEEEVQAIFKSSFPSKLNDMMIIKNIPAYGLCPHHVCPVSMRIWIGYIPHESVLGLSKFRRLVKLLAQKPILQEELTEVIADYIVKYLKPDGVIVVINGNHMCMSMRGIEQPDAEATSSAVRGNFKNHKTKSEFLSLIQKEL